MNKISCCLCGMKTLWNEAAMCLECLRSRFDITEDIENNIELLQCSKCNKWNQRLDQWISHDLESTGNNILLYVQVTL